MQAFDVVVCFDDLIVNTPVLTQQNGFATLEDAKAFGEDAIRAHCGRIHEGWDHIGKHHPLKERYCLVGTNDSGSRVIVSATIFPYEMLVGACSHAFVGKSKQYPFDEVNQHP